MEESSSFVSSGTLLSVVNHELGYDFLVKQQQGVDLVRDDEATEELAAADENGFRTPTRQDMKIPLLETCPPAPRKPPPPPPSRKRRTLFPVDQSAMLADLSAEIKRLSSSPPPEKKARVFIAQPAKVM